MLVHVDEATVHVQTLQLSDSSITSTILPVPALPTHVIEFVTASITDVSIDPFVVRMLLTLNGHILRGVISGNSTTATLELTLHPTRTLLVETDYVTHAFESTEAELVLVGCFQVAAQNAATFTQAYEVRKFVNNNCVVRQQILMDGEQLKGALYKPQLNVMLITYVDNTAETDALTFMETVIIPVNMLELVDELDEHE